MNPTATWLSLWHEMKFPVASMLFLLQSSGTTEAMPRATPHKNPGLEEMHAW